MDIFNKSDVLNYINEHNKEHGGHLTTESGFKKNFPSLYDDFIKTSFPSFFEGFDFKQKLWHFLRDDYTQHICLCGNPLKFRSFWYGYNSIVITSWIGTLSNVVPAAIPPIVVGTLSVLV